MQLMLDYRGFCGLQKMMHACVGTNIWIIYVFVYCTSYACSFLFEFVILYLFNITYVCSNIDTYVINYSLLCSKMLF